MYLKQFGLEFANVDRQTNWRLTGEIRCVLALYERCFPRFKVDRAWKVHIECMPTPERTGVINSLGCCILQVRFNLEAYECADIRERKRIALETVHQGALAVARSSGWPTEPFETAYKGVIERDYVNEWTWPKSPKSSSDRKHKAYLQCLHEHDGFYAWLVIEDKKGNQLAKELAFKELPSEFCFVPKLGKLEWTSNDRVVLFDNNGNEIKALSI